jgi:hypothetical protein
MEWDLGLWDERATKRYDDDQSQTKGGCKKRG